MTAIIKTLPTMFARGRIREFLDADFVKFYFSLGRGRPKKPPTELYFTHRATVLGHFDIEEIVKNAGQLPKLTTLDGEASGWQIKPDRWVAICRPPFRFLQEKLFYVGFRGWHYFDLDHHRGTLDSKVRL